MKVTVVIRNDHEALRALFDKFNRPAANRTNNNGKKELFNEIRREILLHSQMEQEIFYPALTGTTSARALELVSKAEEEHRSVEKLLDDLSTMNGSDKGFESGVAQLIDEVVGHIEMEEGEIFDEARKNLPEYRLEELGLEMEHRKRIVTTLAA